MLIWNLYYNVLCIIAFFKPGIPIQAVIPFFDLRIMINDLRFKNFEYISKG